MGWFGLVSKYFSAGVLRGDGKKGFDWFIFFIFLVQRKLLLLKYQMMGWCSERWVGCLIYYLLSIIYNILYILYEQKRRREDDDDEQIV